MRKVPAIFILLTMVLHADEGMWLYSNPPLEQWKRSTTSCLPSSGSSTCRSRPSGSITAARVVRVAGRARDDEPSRGERLHRG